MLQGFLDGEKPVFVDDLPTLVARCVDLRRFVRRMKRSRVAPDPSDWS